MKIKTKNHVEDYNHTYIKLKYKPTWIETWSMVLILHFENFKD